MKPIHLLQVGNVGQILGGTAACMWTITRSLPEMKHTVAFLSPVTTETQQVFESVRTLFWRELSSSVIRQTGADVVLLHNTSSRRLQQRLPLPSLQYQHSKISLAPAHRHLCCSQWLADQTGGDMETVCWQPVPTPPLPDCFVNTTAELIIGRICTPTSRKWPGELVEVYRTLAEQFPQVLWEFVGCPRDRQSALLAVCGGRAEFFPAGWSKRERYWHWDAVLYHHPTLTESFGRITAEAMRAGCVPIVDHRGGFIEQIPPECGFLCEQSEDFTQAIKKLLQPGERKQLSCMARKHADDKFSEAAFADRFREQLRLLVGNSKRVA